MSVEIRHLYKTLGSQEILHDICLSVPQGQVLGLLGPNGAGKSTLMKILIGYWSFDSNDTTEVKVCNIDLLKTPHEVASKIGYLPENNPLYDDMYVREYLLFMAELSRLPRSARHERVDTLIQQVGITREQHKKIGQLSKGYRQRIGLAQAMMGNPEVLILDEPTTGLDPNQLADIRSLIKTLGKDRTVILSTHIMQEVKEMCNRVVILNNGNIVAEENDLTGIDLEQLFRQKTKHYE